MMAGPHNSAAARDLRAAWDEMIGSLGRARDAIEDPRLMPPPATERNLAEGYRYLLGFVHSAVERAFHEERQAGEVQGAATSRVLRRSTVGICAHCPWCSPGNTTAGPPIVQ